MIAIDTNILIYAHRKECSGHGKALNFLRSVSEGARPWGLPWPCVYEFLRVVTHPKIFNPPTSVDVALSNIKTLMVSPSILMLHETEKHVGVLDDLVQASKIDGNLFFDAHIAAICLENGFLELATADSDFNKFPGIVSFNPLV